MRRFYGTWYNKITRHVRHGEVDNSRMIQDPITEFFQTNQGDPVSHLIAPDLIIKSVGNKRMGRLPADRSKWNRRSGDLRERDVYPP